MNKQVTPIEPAFRDDLAEAQDLPAAAALRARAVALEAYAKEARDPELINHAVEVRLKAERKAGEMLRDMGERRGGDQTSREGSLPSNKDLGITDKQSHFWQALAALDEPTFLERLSDAQRAAASAIELTPDERKREKQDRRAEREAELGARIEALPDERYGVIYADPPWRFVLTAPLLGHDVRPLGGLRGRMG